MEFKKFPSLTNHYDTGCVMRWLECYPTMPHTIFVITEKIHGCNFQIAVDGDEVRCGSRNGWVGGDGLYGVMSYVHMLDPLINMMKLWSKAIESSFVLYGEFFGEGIHKEINYGPKQFRFFSLVVNGKRLPFEKFIGAMRSFEAENLIVPVVGYRQGLLFALEHEDTFISAVGAGKEHCEGIVIEPFHTVFAYRDTLLLFKKKNEKFREAMGVPKVKEALPSNILGLREEFLSFIVDARLQSVFSKEGMITEKKDIGRYVSLLVQDAKEEFLSLYPDIPKDTQKHIFKIGNAGFKLILPYLGEEA